jgi:hypothetical protein
VTAIFWDRALLVPVCNWDRLSLSECERLLRGLFRCVGTEVPAQPG